jgi:hypothetical protein
MPEIISYPSCRRKLQAPDDVLGQEMQSPTCGATFTAALGDGPVRKDRSGEGLTSGGQTCGLIATILGAIGLVLTFLNFLQPGDRSLFGRGRW